MKKLSLLYLFFIFVKIGAIAIGGGFVILPILENELSDKRKLILKTELLDFFALSQSMPGIIAANISMLTGYQLKGLPGAIVAMLGVIFAPFVCIILIASILDGLLNNQYVQGLFWGVGIAVLILIFSTIKEIWIHSKRDLFFDIIFILALISLLILKLSPAKTIVMFTLLGLLYKRIEYIRRKQ